MANDKWSVNADDGLIDAGKLYINIAYPGTPSPKPPYKQGEIVPDQDTKFDNRESTVGNYVHGASTVEFDAMDYSRYHQLLTSHIGAWHADTGMAYPQELPELQQQGTGKEDKKHKGRGKTSTHK